jgi:SWI/SNF chromatin-remodeling complex subunit SWI1
MMNGQSGVPNPALSGAGANPAAMAAIQQQRTQFLRTVAQTFINHKQPLPPQLTGIMVPYDPMTSPFAGLDVTGVGVIRVAGKELDLFRVWHTLIKMGGTDAVGIHHLFKPSISRA